MSRQAKINDATGGEFVKGGVSNDRKPILDRPTQAKLGKTFHEYCKSLVEQPLPQEFISLLAEIEAQERATT